MKKIKMYSRNRYHNTSEEKKQEKMKKNMEYNTNKCQKKTKNEYMKECRKDQSNVVLSKQ